MYEVVQISNKIKRLSTINTYIYVFIFELVFTRLCRKSYILITELQKYLENFLKANK